MGIGGEKNMTVAQLSVDGISHTYAGKKALDNVSFTIDPGELLALLGPNGAGKSTLFALVTRLLKCQQGEIAIAGANLKQSREKVLRGVGVVFQQSTLDPDLTVAQNLAYHAALHGISSKQAKLAATRELERLSLTDTMNTRVRKLNGGHRRRVEIARALLHQPQMLLLDEATVGLDVESRELLNRHVRSLCQEKNLSVLWTTHLIDEIQPHDKLLLIHRGHTQAYGEVQAVLQKNKCPDLRTLFSHFTGAKK